VFLSSGVNRMASANEPGVIRIVFEDPQGNQTIVWEGRSDGPINAGKSPDGALANLTADKQLVIPMALPIANEDWKIRMFFSSDAVDGLDASDCIFLVPITEDNGLERQLNTTDFGFSTDVTLPATSFIELGTGFTILAGKRTRFGSASLTTTAVISIEDDTA